MSAQRRIGVVVVVLAVLCLVALVVLAPRDHQGDDQTKRPRPGAVMEAGPESGPSRSRSSAAEERARSPGA